MQRETHHLGIGQVAKRTGLAISAIRYYEDEGLIKVLRNTGGQRRFKPSDIRRLSFIMVSQQLGFSLADIRHHLKSLPEQRTPTKKDWEKLSKQFKKVLEQRIKSLQLLNEKLDGCIGCGCLSLKNCSLYNPEDRLAEQGAGPRHLVPD